VDEKKLRETARLALEGNELERRIAVSILLHDAIRARLALEALQGGKP
jgi:hypothetical protein